MLGSGCCEMEPPPKKRAVSAVAWTGMREPLFCAKIAVETTWQATCTSHKIVVKLLDGLCVFESWRKERKRTC